MKVLAWRESSKAVKFTGDGVTTKYEPRLRCYSACQRSVVICVLEEFAHVSKLSYFVAFRFEAVRCGEGLVRESETESELKPLPSPDLPGWRVAASHPRPPS